MQHPVILKQELARCHESNTSNDKQIDCEIVFDAAINFNAIIEEQQGDPEKFGQRIMQVQYDYVMAKNKFHEAEQTLQSLRQKKATETELNTASAQLEQAKTIYHKKEYEMKLLLAVMGLNSPE